MVAELRRKGLTVLSCRREDGPASFKSLTEGHTRIKSTRQGGLLAPVRHHDQCRSRAVARACTSSRNRPRTLGSGRSSPRCGRTSRPAVRSRTPWRSIRRPSTGSTSTWCGPGEIGGVLDLTLERLATQLEKDDSLRRSIKSAMTYPILIASFAILVMIGHDPVHHPDLRQHVQRTWGGSCRC